MHCYTFFYLPSVPFSQLKFCTDSNNPNVTRSTIFIQKVFELLLRSTFCFGAFTLSCLVPFAGHLLKATCRGCCFLPEHVVCSVAGQAKTTLVWITLLLQWRMIKGRKKKKRRKKARVRGSVCAQLRLGKWEWWQRAGKLTDSSARQGFTTGC